MILTFTTKDEIDYIAINGGMPLAQKNGGCRSMFRSALRCMGISWSDKPIEGWAPATGGSYFYGHIKDYGQVVSGAVEAGTARAIGFNPQSEHMCWSAGNQLHRCNKPQAKKALALQQNEMNAYLAGLFPAKDILQNPTKAKKPKRLKGVAVIGLV